MQMEFRRGIYLALCCFFVTACAKLPRTTTQTAGGVSHTASPSLLLDSAKPSTPLPVNINTATADELERLPGIGAGFAARIIEHRTRYGMFRRKEHLLLVRGMGERRYQRLAAFITVE